MRTQASVLAVLLATMGATGMAAAGHMEPRTRTCDYEFAGTGDIWSNTIVDPFGPTLPPDELPEQQPIDDGSLNWSGCMFEFVETNPGLSKEPQDNPQILILQGYPVGEDDGEPNSEWETVVVQIEDDVFGSNVGGFLCGDVNGNYVCGEEGEIFGDFCGGTSPTLGPFTGNASDPDSDGHLDLGWHLTVFVNGPLSQTNDCENTANPVGGAFGGLVDEQGGISLLLGGTQQ